MAEKSDISWTDATFNPWIGCTKVSRAATGGGGCDHCYAEVSTPARVLRAKGAESWGTGAPRVRTSAANWRQPVASWNVRGYAECPACKWRGEWSACDGFLRSACPKCFATVNTARRRVFCASLADVFDNEVDPQWRVDLLMLIRATPNLDWLLLTKRVGNVTRLLQEVEDLLKAHDRLDGWDWLHDWTCGSPPANVWLGATIVNQEEADRDIPKLLATPARLRFLSMEPLLGPVDLVRRGADGSLLDCLRGDWLREEAPAVPGVGMKLLVGDGPHLDWIIVGGESGPGARPMHPDWALSLRDQCAAVGVAFHFKQWGEFVHGEQAACGLDDCYRLSKVGGWVEHNGDISLGEAAVPARPGAAHVFKPGKKAAGRLLDGVEHNAFPEVAHG